MTSTSSSQTSSNLLAVFLITRSRPGPKLVFHYPPDPSKESQGQQDAQNSELSDSDSDEHDDSGGNNRGRGSSDSTVRHVGLDSAGVISDVKDSDPLDRIFGHSVDTLERFLAAGRWSDKKKFEVCLDGITFVGLPMHAREDGSWTSSKQNERRPEPAKPVQPAYYDYETGEELLGSVAGITITRPTGGEIGNQDFAHAPDSLDSRLATSFGTSMGSASTASGAVAEQMTMFHVVFALSVADTGVKNRFETKEVFEQLARPLSKALKYCQKQSNYVAIESRKLLALKAKAKVEKLSSAALWTQMLEHSGLAWALKEVYTQISAGEIATIRLDGSEVSLHILSHAATTELEEMSLHHAILLLENRDALLQTLASTHNTPSTQALAYYVRECTPTKSLAKHATNLSIPPKTVLTLARHLVQWRKARLIAPLHPRNTYIIHPEAPLNKLNALSDEYIHQFPALPNLESILRMLGGGRPVRFGLLIQSKDHRTPYMEILAWLVQKQLVVLLRTLGWLRMSRVRASGELEEREERLKPTSVAGLLGARLRSRSHERRRSRSSSESDQASEDTAIPVDTTEAVENGHSDDDDTSGAPDTGLITHPLDPTSAQRAVLRRIRASLDDVEFEARFPSLLKYFDGEHAVEDIAGLEGLKRAKVEEWIGALERRGWLRIVRSV